MNPLTGPQVNRVSLFRISHQVFPRTLKAKVLQSPARRDPVHSVRYGRQRARYNDKRIGPKDLRIRGSKPEYVYHLTEELARAGSGLIWVPCRVVNRKKTVRVSGTLAHLGWLRALSEAVPKVRAFLL